MADEAHVDQGNKGSSVTPDAEKKDSGNTKTKCAGIFSRIWNMVFRLHEDDFEKRLQNISKAEAIVLNRIRKRSQNWRSTARQLIIFSFGFWVIAVGYAIMTTRSLDMDWKMRAFRVLPMFVLPALSFLAYSAVGAFVKMRDHKDQKTLEKLRAERQEKIDELKEKTNYYITQRLIERYDPDPAAKAAAATILASKMGADSGLKVYLGDESNKLNDSKGKSNVVEGIESSGLRNRKPMRTRSSKVGNTSSHHSNEETLIHEGTGVPGITKNQPFTVEHYQNQEATANDGGWLARVAALLVGEDPTQSFALICGNCHMHNGLARKEDFAYISYYCPHCHALNKSKQTETHVSSPSSHNEDLTLVDSDSVLESSDTVIGTTSIEGEKVASASLHS